jgi:hypothetical protein
MSGILAGYPAIFCDLAVRPARRSSQNLSQRHFPAIFIVATEGQMFKGNI